MPYMREQKHKYPNKVLQVYTYICIYIIYIYIYIYHMYINIYGCGRLTKFVTVTGGKYQPELHANLV